MLAAVPTVVTIIVVLVIGDVVGSMPIANWVARRHGVDDLRTVGDRNPGYWNARMQLSDREALPIFAGDVAKGVIAAVVGLVLADDGQWWLPYLAGGAAMVGHAWPMFAGFRGGRSVSTFVGVGLVCAPVPAMMAVIVTGIAWWARRDLAVSARAGIIAFPVLQLVTEGANRTAATGALMTFVGLRFALARSATRSDGHARSDRV